MSKFKTLFGIEKNKIRENCIILPLVPKGVLKDLGISALAKGKLYNCANTDKITVIQTGVGAGFCADAVLYLRNSPARSLILFGSCGLTPLNKSLSIGSLILPYKSYAYESFTEMLLNKNSPAKAFYPDKHLYERFYVFARNKGFKLDKSIAATLASLKLEEDLEDLFKRKMIEAVDMESSAFFAAAKYINLKAITLFYVSDIIKQNPFYLDMSFQLKDKLTASIKNAIKLICDFTEGN